MPPSDEGGGPEGEKKTKICTIYRKFVQIESFSLPHPSGAPSSEGATKQEPLRLILTCSISTVPTSLRLRGRTPREGRPYGRIGRQFDKSVNFSLSLSLQTRFCRGGRPWKPLKKSDFQISTPKKRTKTLIYTY